MVIVVIVDHGDNDGYDDVDDVDSEYGCDDYYHDG